MRSGVRTRWICRSGPPSPSRTAPRLMGSKCGAGLRCPVRRAHPATVRRSPPTQREVPPRRASCRRGWASPSATYDERSGEASGLVHRGRAVGMHDGPVGRGAGDRDAKTAGIAPDLLEPGPRGRRRHIRIARRRPRGGIEQGGAVPHRSGHGMLGHEAAEHVAVVGAQRVPAPGGLEPEEAAAGRRNADGAASVIGLGHRTMPAATAAAEPPLDPPVMAWHPRIPQGPKRRGSWLGGFRTPAYWSGHHDQPARGIVGRARCRA